MPRGRSDIQCVTRRWRPCISLWPIIPLLALAIGCATMSEPGQKLLVVESEPTGAFVYLNDKPAGQTPLSTQVPTQHSLAGWMSR